MIRHINILNIKVFNKIKRYFIYTYKYKNFIRAALFRSGKFTKGNKVEIYTRSGDRIIVARGADYWLLDHVANGLPYEVQDEIFVIDNIHLRMGTSDTFIYKEIFIDKEYEKCLPFLNDKSVVIDIGAHIGLFSIYIADMVKQVYSLEASKNNYDLACKNLSNANVNSNVEIKNYALWSSSKELINIGNNVDKGSTCSFTVSLEKTSNNQVETISLIDFLEGCNLNTCDFLKIDIEGAEYESLLSNPSVFKKIDTLLLEYHIDILNKYTLSNLTSELGKSYKYFKLYPTCESTGLILASNNQDFLKKIDTPKFKNSVKNLNRTL